MLVLQVLCWGVRDMKRFQLLQVKSPLAEFECGGVAIKSNVIKNANENPNFQDPVLSMDVVSDTLSLSFSLSLSPSLFAAQVLHIQCTCIFEREGGREGEGEKEREGEGKGERGRGRWRRNRGRGRERERLRVYLVMMLTYM